MTAMPSRAVATALVVLLLAACGRGASPPPATPTVPAGERLELAPREVVDGRPVAGEVTTRDAVVLPARIPGTLVALDVQEGDAVRAGQRIGRIRDARIGEEAAAAGALVRAAQAEADRAAAELARVRDLYDNKVYAKARLDQAVAQADAAAAQLAAAQAQAQAGRAIVAQGELVAPAAGRVLDLPLPVGAIVAPGTPVALLAGGPVILRLDVPESVAAGVQPGAVVTVPAGGDGAAALEGRVTQVHPAVAGGRVRIDADVPGLAAEPHGRRVAAVLEAGRRTALVVPRRFVATRFGIDYVRVAVGQGTQDVVVQTAPAPGGGLELVSGVHAGDALLAVQDAP